VSRRPATTVLLCRGCCCGTAAKHPQLDHEQQEQALRAAAGHAEIGVRVVDCLDECDRSNVVVVRRPGRLVRDRDTWFGSVLTDGATDALAAWLHEGAPERLPPRLVGLRFRHQAPRRRR